MRTYTYFVSPTGKTHRVAEYQHGNVLTGCGLVLDQNGPTVGALDPTCKRCGRKV